MFGTPVVAQQQITEPPPHDNWVAIAVTPQAIVMSTRALRRYGLPVFQGGKYRVRSIPVGPQKSVSAVTLSADGTQLRVTVANKDVTIDLTKPVPEVEDGATPTMPFHPRQPIAHLVNAELTRFAREEVQRRFLVNAVWPTTMVWHVYDSAEPDQYRYAPVLRQLPEEQVWPSRFDVWTDITAQLNPASTVTSSPKKAEARQELLRAYYLIEGRRCSIYARPVSRPGSWLMEYWLYYPFDYGLNGHLHDSEHIFVEVDRLGGAVRRVAGAGHGLWAANSIYHTFATDAIPVTLPVHALVELGKHATAPDINDDGVFTPGVDSNIYRDTAKVWGVRDTTGLTDSSLRPFDGTMAVPRDRDSRRRTLKPHPTPQPASPTDPVVQCDLLPLAQSSVAATATVCDTNPLSPDCAGHHVLHHTDARDPNRILKPEAFPRQYLRADWSTRRGRTTVDGKGSAFGVGFGFELQTLGKVLPLPGRLYSQITAGTEAPHLQRILVSYEALRTNLSGFYVGVANERRAVPVDDDRFSSVLTGGMLFEFPLPIKWPDGLGSGLNLHARIGIATDGRTGIGFEAHGGIAISYGSLFRKFGIRSRDPNPY
jgi:hypothetical protein